MITQTWNWFGMKLVSLYDWHIFGNIRQNQLTWFIPFDPSFPFPFIPPLNPGKDLSLPPKNIDLNGFGVLLITVIRKKMLGGKKQVLKKQKSPLSLGQCCLVYRYSLHKPWLLGSFGLERKTHYNILSGSESVSPTPGSPRQRCLSKRSLSITPQAGRLMLMSYSRPNTTLQSTAIQCSYRVIKASCPSAQKPKTESKHAATTTWPYAQDHEGMSRDKTLEPQLLT